MAFRMAYIIFAPHFNIFIAMKTGKYTLLLATMLLTSLSVFAQIGISNTTNKEGEIVLLTKKDFLERVYNYEKNSDRFVYEGTLPCIVDFYADWCPPCKAVDPILKDLASEYKDKIIIYKVNVDNEKALATAFGIQYIPTYFFIPAKGDPQVANSAMPRESFIQAINTVLLK